MYYVLLYHNTSNIRVLYNIDTINNIPRNFHTDIEVIGGGGRRKGMGRGRGKGGT